MTPATSYEFRTEPYAHQGLGGVLARWREPWWAWLLEMGLGKSKIAIDNFCMLVEAGEVDRLLVLGPKGMYANWTRKEIPTHMPVRHLEGAIVHLWEGGGTRREQRAIEELLAEGDRRLRVLVVNTEALSSGSRGWDLVQAFTRGGRTMVVLDESSMAKNPRALRTKRIVALGRLARYRRIMSGTPVPRSPLDAWSQFEFLERAALGHRSYFSFRARYALMEQRVFGGRTVQVVTGYRDVEHLSRIVGQHSSVLKKEDCLDLPPKVYSEWEVELTPEQRRVYTELREYATAELGTGRFTSATVVIAQLLRMHQAVCGYATDEAGEIVDLPSNRPDEWLQVLESVGGKAVTWCSYKRNVEQLVAAATRAGYRALRYDGTVPAAQRPALVQEFQESSEPVQFIGTAATGGYGITLTAARALIYFSNTADLEKRLQSEDRPHRIGLDHSLPVIDLVARGTIDEKLIQILRSKESLSDLVLLGEDHVRRLLDD